MLEQHHQKASQIKCVILDVDGVLTDGRIYLTDSGHEFKAFHAHDGMGIKMLLEAGLEVAIITARTSPLVFDRMKELGVKHIYQNQYPKSDAYEEIKKNLALEHHEIAYMGDDLVDLPVMRTSGLSIAPANAISIVLKHADWLTQNSGGNGAVREAVEFILAAQNKLDTLHASYL